MAGRRKGLRKLPSVGEDVNILEMVHLKHNIQIEINASSQVISHFPSTNYKETAAFEHEKFVLVGCGAVVLALTTSGDSMSCRKE